MMKICVLGSGSKGNATFFESGGSGILIDAGFSCKSIEERLKFARFDPKDVSAVVISHEHGDHIHGAWRFSAKWGIPVYINSVLKNSKCLPKKITCDIRYYDSGDSLTFNGLNLSTFPVLHDAAATVGFRISNGTSAAAIATDLGVVDDTVCEYLDGCETIVIEANHDTEMLRTGPYPVYLKQRIASENGHISNNECGKLLSEIWSDRIHHIFLAHLSQTNNRPDIAFNSVARFIKSQWRPEQKVLLTLQVKPSPAVEV